MPSSRARRACQTASIFLSVALFRCGRSRRDTAGAGDFINLQRPDAGHAPMCDDAGNCSCVNIASIGKPGHYGATGDNTTVFTDWLNSKSSAVVDLYATHPTLTQNFLSKYDVLI